MPPICKVCDKAHWPHCPSQAMKGLFLSCRIIETKEATYEPWTDGHAIGFKVTSPGGRVEYVYLNPSSETDDGVPNVFLYAGPHGDPGQDPTVVYHDLFKVTP